MRESFRILTERVITPGFKKKSPHLHSWPHNLSKYDSPTKSPLRETYRAFSHDVTAAILVFQNNETAAMLVYEENPLGVELLNSYVNAFFCPNKFA